MPLLLEILHDEVTGILPTEAVHIGLGLVQEASGGDFEVVREDRLIRYAMSAETRISDTKTSWPAELSADVSIVMTNRALYLEGFGSGPNTCTDLARPETALRLLSGIALRTSGVAIVSVVTSTSEGLDIIAAHEVAHLLGVVGAERGCGPSNAHCPKGDCIMYQDPIIATYPAKDPSTTRKRLKSLLGITDNYPSNGWLQTSFCDDCRSELRVRYNELRPTLTKPSHKRSRG